MENFARTTEFLARREAWATELRAQLAELLQNRTRIVLEIGSGHGHFLTAYATAHPESFCIGIDIMRDRLARSERKRQRARLANLAFVQAEAAVFVECLPPNVLIDRVFILFPDPWPKRRHHKNRLLQHTFLHALGKVSAEGAHLYFRTDHVPYFTAAFACVVDHPDWLVTPTATWPFEAPTVFQHRAPAYQSWIAVRQSRIQPRADRLASTRVAAAPVQ